VKLAAPKATPLDRFVYGALTLLCGGTALWLLGQELGVLRRPPRAISSARPGRAAPAQKLGLAGARQAIKARRWQRAIDALDQIDANEASAEDAPTLRATAFIELRNRALLGKVKRLMVDGELQAATEAMRAIAEQSVYKREAWRLVMGTDGTDP
jgi:hypothetical protein